MKKAAAALALPYSELQVVVFYWLPAAPGACGVGIQGIENGVRIIIAVNQLIARDIWVKVSQVFWLDIC